MSPVCLTVLNVVQLMRMNLFYGHCSRSQSLLLCWYVDSSLENSRSIWLIYIAQYLKYSSPEFVRLTAAVNMRTF